MNFLKNKYFPYIFSFVLLIPSVVWIFLDNHVWPWDQAWYGEVSVDLYYKLIHSFSEWPKAMMSAFGVKAPAIAWLGQFFVPVGVIVGSIDRALLISIIVTQFITLVFLYKIVMALSRGNKLLAILACFIMGSAPLFIGMGHQYFVESLQLLATTLFIFILIRINTWNRYDKIIALIFAVSLAMLVKITSPLYIIIPSFFIAFNLLKNPKKITIKEYFNEKRHVIYYIFGLLFMYCVIAWYVSNWNSIFQFMKQASSGSVAELYGARGAFFNKLDLWLIFFKKSFFIPSAMYFLFFIIGLFLFQYIFLKKHKLGELPVLIAVPSVALILVLFAFQINEETRYLLPLLPYVVIFICWLLYKINSHWVNVAAIIIFGFQFIFVNAVTLGVIKGGGKDISAWDTVMSIIPKQKKDIMEIIKQTCNLEDANKVSVIGVEFPFLNANSVEYYATQQKLASGFQCYYTSLGYAESNSDKAIIRVKDSIKPPYYITVSKDSFPAADAFNVVSVSVAESIENDKNFLEQKFSELESIRIFKNVTK